MDLSTYIMCFPGHYTVVNDITDRYFSTDAKPRNIYRGYAKDIPNEYRRYTIVKVVSSAQIPGRVEVYVEDPEVIEIREEEG